MTDIRDLELAVIEAARVVSRCAPGGVGPSSNADLRDALKALDAALKPDAWQLLAEAKQNIAVNKYELHKKIGSALEWKEKQND